MKIYPYNLDTTNLEIFPKNIWEDPLVVFHGTSLFHSAEIESKGFIKGISPYQIGDVQELIKILSLPEVRKFDVPRNNLHITTLTTLSNYVIANQNKTFRLSFSYLSFLCVFFANGISKGGQTIGDVRVAKDILDNALVTYPHLAELVTERVDQLFQLAVNVEREDGVVYAVRLPNDLKGITEEYGVIHSELSIPRDLIVGKVILPKNINLHSYDVKVASEKNKVKLLKPRHLGVMLHGNCE